MTAAIEIRDLTKKFGSRVAVNSLNLTVGGGEIFGLVGPNGAGKTTAMRALVTLLKPDRGEIFVGGYSIKKNLQDARRILGFMPDSFGVYNDLTVREYLDFFGACYKIHPARRSQLISDLLDLVDLGHRRDDMVDALSTGLKQRLGLARVLIHDPQILVLDEPASGLDPRARVEIRELLLEIARLGKTIFFSSHILADVAELCDRVGILEAGRLVACGTQQELSAQAAPRRRLRIGVLERREEAAAFLSALPAIEQVNLPEDAREREKYQIIEADFSGDDRAVHELLAALLRQGFPVAHFAEETKKLEEIFMRTTKGIVS